MSKKYTVKEVLYILNSLNYIWVIKEYYNNKFKLTFKDVDGYYYYANLDSLLSGKIPDKFHKANPFTIQNIKLWLKINSKPFELVSDKYEGNNKKLKWKCLKEGCGEIFDVTWGNITQNKGCPYCCIPVQKVSLSNCLATKRPDLAAEWHLTLNGDLTPYDITSGSNKKVWWQCSKNPKHVWKEYINNRSRGRNCPFCSGHQPSEEYNLLFCNPEICKEWNYKRNKKSPEKYTPKSNQKVWWICKECGYEWKINISHRTSGDCCGCSKCAESKGEKEISSYLTELNIDFISQYRFDNCVYKRKLPFDFYLPKFNMCIEYDGKQHFEPIKWFGGEKGFKKQQMYDKIKNDYCNKNNINLIRIPYWNFNKIKEIIIENINNINNINNSRRK